MTRRLGRIALLFLLAVAAPTAFAQNSSGVEGNDEILTEDFILLPPDLWFPGDGNDGRNDVREATLPPAPSGPATPMPFCGPGDPICP